MKTQKMLKKICRIWSKRVSRYKVVEIQTDITTPHFVFEQEFHIYNNSINLYFDAFGVMGFHGKLKSDHPVQAVYSHCLPFQSVGHYVPALCEFLYGIRTQSVGLCLRARVFLILYYDLPVFRHCLHHCCKVCMP